MTWRNAISETQNTFLHTTKKFDMAKGKYYSYKLFYNIFYKLQIW